MLKFVLVDFDDTLVDTGPRFRARRDALFHYLESLGFPRARAYRVHHEVVDPELLGLWGYGPFRLGASFRDTYVRLCAEEGVEPDSRAALRAEELAAGIDAPAPPIPGALEGLERLASRYPVAIYTQSSYPEYQRKCVEGSGVLDIVPADRLIITPVKSAATYLETLVTLRAGQAATSCMVGNSMRSDVNPAIEAGARAIWINGGDPWHADLAEPVDAGVPRAESFADAVDLLLRPRGGPSERGSKPLTDS